MLTFRLSPGYYAALALPRRFLPLIDFAALMLRAAMPPADALLLLLTLPATPPRAMMPPRHAAAYMPPYCAIIYTASPCLCRSRRVRYI